MADSERVDIADMPNKGRSSTSDGIVTFAKASAEKDEAFQQYVVVHEPLQLLYRTHSKRLDATMSALVQDWREPERLSQPSTERRWIGF